MTDDKRGLSLGKWWLWVVLNWPWLRYPWNFGIKASFVSLKKSEIIIENDAHHWLFLTHHCRVSTQRSQMVFQCFWIVSQLTAPAESFQLLEITNVDFHLKKFSSSAYALTVSFRFTRRPEHLKFRAQQSQDFENSQGLEENNLSQICKNFRI